MEKFVIELLFPAGDAAGDDLRIRIVDGGAERAVLEILQADDIAGLGVAVCFFDLGGIDPVVAVENTRARFDNDAGHGGNLTAEAGNDND